MDLAYQHIRDETVIHPGVKTPGMELSVQFQKPGGIRYTGQNVVQDLN